MSWAWRQGKKRAGVGLPKGGAPRGPEGRRSLPVCAPHVWAWQLCSEGGLWHGARGCWEGRGCLLVALLDPGHHG